VLALSVGTFSFVTIELLPIGLLPLIGADLDRSLSAAGLLVTAYAVVVVLMSLPLTLLTRRVPKRSLLGGLLAGFALAALGSAVAPNFGFLLGSRIVTALTQALFWSVVTSTAVGQFPVQRRGRIVGALTAGTSLAAVVGLPVGTWIGQQAGWRMAFVVMSVVAIATCAAVVSALPTVRPEDEPARTADAPNLRRYLVLLLVITLALTGMFTAYTYVSAHLVDVAGLPPSALSAALLVSGLAGVLGAIAGGTVLPTRSTTALVLPLATMTTALWLLYLAGRQVPVAVTAFALLSFGATSFAAGVGGRMLLVAPGSTDLASAGGSTAYNIGIGGGAGLGGLIVAKSDGVHDTALVAALFAGAALTLLLCEPLLASPAARSGDGRSGGEPWPWSRSRPSRTNAGSDPGCGPGKASRSRPPRADRPEADQDHWR
jgi:predicted MFS family arabinose efflux permease